ncbi:MAG: mandelate racemase, partial [Rhizobacter sp.]|nr:mandelate racemase [Rhizobacter sp.]
DQAVGTRVDDGLPETLAEVVATYGNRWFKLKVSGDANADIERLTRVASVLDGIAEPVHVTLDGNEQFENAEQVIDLWRRMQATSALDRLCASTLFIEQPIKRQQALSASVADLAALRPVIIDESDGEMNAFPLARTLGYTGVSSKTCKGLYKSIVNRMRCDLWNREEPPGKGPCFFMSAEDLTTQPGLSIQQDLALVDLLGITHVERNAHHFIDGFGDRPVGEAQAYLEAHPDLYHLQGGRVRLKVANGRVSTASLDAVGFSSTVQPWLDDTPAMPASSWKAPDRV